LCLHLVLCCLSWSEQAGVLDEFCIILLPLLKVLVKLFLSICSLTGILSPNCRCPASIFLTAVQGSGFAFWIFRVQCVALQIQVSSSCSREAVPLGCAPCLQGSVFDFLRCQLHFSRAGSFFRSLLLILVLPPVSAGTGSALLVLVFGTGGSVPHFCFAAQFASFGLYSVFFALVSACGRCRPFDFRSRQGGPVLTSH
jgi:hypothetical protein